MTDERETACGETHPVHRCLCRRPAGHDTHHQAAQGRDDILWTNDHGTLRTIRRQTPTPEDAAQVMDALRTEPARGTDEPAEKAAVVALGLPLALGIVLLRPYAVLQVAAWYGYGPGPTVRAVLVLLAVLLILGAARWRPAKYLPRGYQVLRNLCSAYLWIGVAVGLAWLFR